MLADTQSLADAFAPQYPTLEETSLLWRVICRKLQLAPPRPVQSSAPAASSFHSSPSSSASSSSTTVSSGTDTRSCGIFPPVEELIAGLIEQPPGRTDVATSDTSPSTIRTAVVRPCTHITAYMTDLQRATGTSGGISISRAGMGTSHTDPLEMPPMSTFAPVSAGGVSLALHRAASNAQQQKARQTAMASPFVNAASYSFSSNSFLLDPLMCACSGQCTVCVSERENEEKLEAASAGAGVGDGLPWRAHGHCLQCVEDDAARPRPSVAALPSTVSGTSGGPQEPPVVGFGALCLRHIQAHYQQHAAAALRLMDALDDNDAADTAADHDSSASGISSSKKTPNDRAAQRRYGPSVCLVGDTSSEDESESKKNEVGENISREEQHRNDVDLDMSDTEHSLCDEEKALQRHRQHNIFSIAVGPASCPVEVVLCAECQQFAPVAAAFFAPNNGSSRHNQAHDDCNGAGEDTPTEEHIKWDEHDHPQCQQATSTTSDAASPIVASGSDTSGVVLMRLLLIAHLAQEVLGYHAASSGEQEENALGNEDRTGNETAIITSSEAFPGRAESDVLSFSVSAVAPSAPTSTTSASMPCTIYGAVHPSGLSKDRTDPTSHRSPRGYYQRSAVVTSGALGDVTMEPSSESDAALGYTEHWRRSLFERDAKKARAYEGLKDEGACLEEDPERWRRRLFLFKPAMFTKTTLCPLASPASGNGAALSAEEKEDDNTENEDDEDFLQQCNEQFEEGVIETTMGAACSGWLGLVTARQKVVRRRQKKGDDDNNNSCEVSEYEGDCSSDTDADTDRLWLDAQRHQPQQEEEIELEVDVSSEDHCGASSGSDDDEDGNSNTPRQHRNTPTTDIAPAPQPTQDPRHHDHHHHLLVPHTHHRLTHADQTNGAATGGKKRRVHPRVAKAASWFHYMKHFRGPQSHLRPAVCTGARLRTVYGYLLEFESEEVLTARYLWLRDVLERRANAIHCIRPADTHSHHHHRHGAGIVNVGGGTSHYNVVASVRGNANHTGSDNSALTLRGVGSDVPRIIRHADPATRHAGRPWPAGLVDTVDPAMAAARRRSAIGTPVYQYELVPGAVTLPPEDNESACAMGGFAHGDACLRPVTAAGASSTTPNASPCQQVPCWVLSVHACYKCGGAEDELAAALDRFEAAALRPGDWHDATAEEMVHRQGLLDETDDEKGHVVGGGAAVTTKGNSEAFQQACHNFITNVELIESKPSRINASAAQLAAVDERDHWHVPGAAYHVGTTAALAASQKNDDDESGKEEHSQAHTLLLSTPHRRESQDEEKMPSDGNMNVDGLVALAIAGGCPFSRTAVTLSWFHKLANIANVFHYLLSEKSDV